MGYSVYIVDDERNICNLIKNEIEWDRLGLELKGIYNNSEDALEDICRNSPDIVITDIQMPCMNGLELIRRTQEAGIEANFIIISGYSYFDYAKQAVKYGVDNYILKPIDHIELNESLERICRKISKSESQFDTLIRDKINAEALRDYYVNNPTANGADSLEQINGKYHFNFSEGLFFAVCIRIDQDRRFEQAPITATRIAGSLNRNISNCCFDFHIVAKNQLSYVGLINCAESESQAMLRGLQYVIDEGNNEYLLGNDAALTIGVSEGFAFLPDRAVYFQQAAKLCECRLILGNNKLYQYDKIPKNSCDFARTLAEMKNQLSEAMVNLSKEAFLEICSEYIDATLGKLREDPLSLSVFNRAYQGCVASLFENAEAENISIDTINNAADYKTAVLEQTKRQFEVYESSFLSVERKSVMEIKSYIRSHLQEKLDLETLSKRFFFSAGYLGQLFKQETGVNITAYINNERIALAKKLLLERDLSIKDVSERTGFNDSKYFTRMFKRSTGISPKEYRKIHNFF